MIDKIVGHLAMTAMMRKLRGGPGSMLPMSPVKGSGVPSGKGVTPTSPKKYVVPAQKPKNTAPRKPWWT